MQIITLLSSLVLKRSNDPVCREIILLSLQFAAHFENFPSRQLLVSAHLDYLIWRWLEIDNLELNISVYESAVERDPQCQKNDEFLITPFPLMLFEAENSQDFAKGVQASLVSSILLQVLPRAK